MSIYSCQVADSSAASGSLQLSIICEIDQAEFPVVCANLDLTSDSLLAGMIVPYTLIEVGGEHHLPCTDGDGYASFSGVEALDTGFIDAEVFMD